MKAMQRDVCPSFSSITPTCCGESSVVSQTWLIEVPLVLAPARTSYSFSVVTLTLLHRATQVWAVRDATDSGQEVWHRGTDGQRTDQYADCEPPPGFEPSRHDPRSGGTHPCKGHTDQESQGNCEEKRIGTRRNNDRCNRTHECRGRKQIPWLDHVGHGKQGRE